MTPQGSPEFVSILLRQAFVVILSLLHRPDKFCEAASSFAHWFSAAACGLIALIKIMTC